MPSRCGVFRVTHIVVNKSLRELLLLHGESVLRSYRIALGRNPVGPKTHEGDGKTPEGRYIVDRRNPRSAYHLALHLSYPNSADCDRARDARSRSRRRHHDPRPSERQWPSRERTPQTDWTQGCIAVTDEEMDEIWELVADGTPIEINP